MAHSDGGCWHKHATRAAYPGTPRNKTQYTALYETPDPGRDINPVSLHPDTSIAIDHVSAAPTALAHPIDARCRNDNNSEDANHADPS